ncbi:MAG TPA: GTPase domain-containing protein [Polyangiaceae bacterium]|nr:GTPase domain-containing protein [Polyangiaceae bacterium]
MAVIDESRGVLVVRIVYDGPALSGKTTSLKALARGVSSEVTTPAETAGRTLFFDWVDYVGGLFDGRQIRCQIVGVPGQTELAHRRGLLVETADAVVLVLDTQKTEWDFSLEWVKKTVPHCRSQDPPVGLVLQANKRDAADAVPQESMRAALSRIAPVALVPSTATTGDGIREAFVLAVRLALDRVRALAATGRLRSAKPDDDNPEDLLSRLQQAEAKGELPLGETFASAVTHSLTLDEAEEVPPSTPPPPDVAAQDSTPPPEEEAFVPDPMMPGGMIWPPVDGRALLHEVASLDIRPTRSGRADWCGSGSGFRFHSIGSALFSNLQSGRNELIEWARLHAANTQHLSPGRAVILAEAGGGRRRLWQIVRAEATLRERLATALPQLEPEELAEELLDVASQLSRAREFFATTTVSLPCTLWTVGANNSKRPTYVGLMPTRDQHLPTEPMGRELLRRELSPQLRELRRSRVDYSEVVAGVLLRAQHAAAETPARWLSEIVSST